MAAAGLVFTPGAGDRSIKLDAPRSRALSLRQNRLSSSLASVCPGHLLPPGSGKSGHSKPADDGSRVQTRSAEPFLIVLQSSFCESMQWCDAEQKAPSLVAQDRSKPASLVMAYCSFSRSRSSDWYAESLSRLTQVDAEGRRVWSAPALRRANDGLSSRKPRSGGRAQEVQNLRSLRRSASLKERTTRQNWTQNQHAGSTRPTRTTLTALTVSWLSSHPP